MNSLLWSHFVWQLLSRFLWMTWMCSWSHAALDWRLDWRRHFGLIVTTFLTFFRVLTKQSIDGSMEKRIRGFIQKEKNHPSLLWHERRSHNNLRSQRTEEDTRRTSDSPEVTWSTQINAALLLQYFHCVKYFHCSKGCERAVMNVQTLKTVKQITDLCGALWMFKPVWRRSSSHSSSVSLCLSPTGSCWAFQMCVCVCVCVCVCPDGSDDLIRARLCVNEQTLMLFHVRSKDPQQNSPSLILSWSETNRENTFTLFAVRDP